MTQKSFTVSEQEGEQTFHALRSEWDALWEESTDVTHFQRWDWQYLYWKHVTPQAIPQFATLRDEQGRCRAIGLLVRTRDPKTGLMTTGFAGGMRSDYNMFLAGNDVPIDAGVELLRAIVSRQRRRASLLALRNIPADSWTARVIEKHLTNGEGDNLFELSEGESYAIPLPRTIDEYIAGLGQRSRHAFGYDRRRITKECIVEFRVHESADHIDVLLDQIEMVDVARWGAESMYRRPQRRAFERSIIKALAKDGLLLVFMLYVDGKPASFALCCLVRGVVEVPRIAHDPSFPSKLSIGKVALFYAIEECIRRGYSKFDLTRGGEAYKGWLGARAERIVNLYVHRSKFDLIAQQCGVKLGVVMRKQTWLRDAYRKYVGG